MQHLRHHDRDAVHFQALHDPLLLFVRQMLQQRQQVVTGVVRPALEMVQHHERLGRHAHGEDRADRTAGQLLERTVAGTEFLRSHRPVGVGDRVKPVDCPEQKVLR
jgi:hypothetical protein